MVLSPSDDNDIIDAIAVGLNMLSEELNTNVVEKSKLDEVNAKLERFAYATAHDLKSPLNAITGLVALIEMSIKDDAKSQVSEYLFRLRATVEKMNGLVRGILEYSKVYSENLEKEEIDLMRVFNEIIDTDQALHKVEIQFVEPLPAILFNKSAIYQVVRNLISNAVKYSDKEICKLQIRATEVEDHYEVSVYDNGPGIAPENHEMVFQLFNKIGARRLTDSHGIGLAMVKRILETAGERI
jgi:signal transduction histidine kinase